MYIKSIKLLLIVIFISFSNILFAQDDLLSLVDNGPKPKEYISNAFKSSRVVNGHSIEFIGKGVLDVRILHRFGLVNSGFSNLWGLDQASMRFGFDYGVTKNFTLGIGRSTSGKEWDGFLKYRLIHQSVGGKNPSPVSVVLITGATISSAPWEFPDRKNYFSSRMGFYNEVIVGRKFNENFSAQIAPTHIHVNLVKGANFTNDFFAMGIGARYKISKRTAFVVDYHYLVRPTSDDDSDDDNSVTNTSSKAYQFKDLVNPLSIGFDVETGGHVFQMHFSNSSGMNEKAFITNTTKSWGKAEVSFGFNLSRVFTVAKN